MTMLSIEQIRYGQQFRTYWRLSEEEYVPIYNSIGLKAALNAIYEPRIYIIVDEYHVCSQMSKRFFLDILERYNLASISDWYEASSINIFFDLNVLKINFVGLCAVRFNRKTTDGRSSCPIRSSPLKDIAGLHQRDEEGRRTVESFNERVAVYRTAEGCERTIWVNTKRAEQIRRNHEHVARREAGVEPAVHKEILRECDDVGGSTRKSRRSRGSSENSMYAYRSGHDVVRIHK
ncbi:uncharacterized protein LOC118447992 isoform X2 [Vespa mandarinia]|uniref:uncharacterized protein LOC118447992 isoform X2 n=2 Tax=Vespa mandarinia TaxID=7446 RepID=UPI001607FE8C|nr:uncharacterized protein LOC118447992 isoform X2 [Vespa mandarinia]